MIPLAHYKGKVVVVFGLGRTGEATALALMESGATVWAWDDGEVAREKAATKNIPLQDINTIPWQDVDRFVLSPGIHPNHPAVVAAIESRVAPVADIELLFESQPNATFIALTGTNGKSTTTSLVGHLLQKLGHNVQIGGNIGTAVLGLHPFMKKGIYVLEISSFQLDLLEKFRAHIAVLTNITEDHLDHHGSLGNYVAAKMKLFNNQTAEDICVVGIDSPLSAAIYEGLLSQNQQTVFPVSSGKTAPGGVFVDTGTLYDDFEQTGTAIGDVNTNKSLQGIHNHQNIAAAYAVCRSLGSAPNQILKHLDSYTGLPHRQEWVDEIKGVTFINNTLATSPDAASHALAAYENTYWIVGGKRKTDDFSAIVTNLGNVTKAFIIGEETTFFEELLTKHNIPHDISKTLDIAVSAAFADAAQGEPATVLLAPACASYDQYDNFAQRGDSFKKIVRNLSVDTGSKSQIG